MSGQTKKQRREFGREAARVLREAERRHHRRRRFAVQAGVITLTAGVLAVAGLFVMTGQRAELNTAAGPRNMQSDGFVVTESGPKRSEAIPAGGTPIPSVPNAEDAPAAITLYVDYLCPHCADFERENAEFLNRAVAAGATVEIHPIATLTSLSQGTRYSERAANAFACAADLEPTIAAKFQEILFAHQPEERTPGLTDDELVQYLREAGSKNVGVLEECVDGGRFINWVRSATNRAVTQHIPNSGESTFSGTPFVVVNGEVFNRTTLAEDDFQTWFSKNIPWNVPTAPESR